MSASTAHEIGIVHYPGAQVACILGLTDLFGVASTMPREWISRASTLRENLASGLAEHNPR